jgi:hypothetical protein
MIAGPIPHSGLFLQMTQKFIGMGILAANLPANWLPRIFENASLNTFGNFVIVVERILQL